MQSRDRKSNVPTEVKGGEKRHIRELVISTMKENR